jgi:hypothetical protein
MHLARLTKGNYRPRSPPKKKKKKKKEEKKRTIK